MINYVSFCSEGMFLQKMLLGSNIHFLAAKTSLMPSSLHSKGNIIEFVASLAMKPNLKHTIFKSSFQLLQNLSNCPEARSKLQKVCCNRFTLQGLIITHLQTNFISDCISFLRTNLLNPKRNRQNIIFMCCCILEFLVNLSFFQDGQHEVLKCQGKNPCIDHNFD
jgi:hypothetical protein